MPAPSNENARASQRQLLGVIDQQEPLGHESFERQIDTRNVGGFVAVAVRSFAAANGAWVPTIVPTHVATGTSK